jgi:parvulin-like peptidyl-prolyl isomerase
MYYNRVFKISTYLFLILICITSTVSARTMQLTQDQVSEYLLNLGRNPEAGKTIAEQDKISLEILEHTLLSIAWESLNIPLSNDNLGKLYFKHEEISIRVLQERIANPGSVTMQEIEDWFEVSKGRYHASHILVGDKMLADSLYSILEAGKPFEHLARIFSTDPGGKENGGVLGAVRTGDTVMEFEDALLKLQPAEFSRPVRTPFGWHIIRMDKIEIVESDINDEIRKEMRRALEKKSRRLDELRLKRELMANHQIEVYPRIILDSRKPDTAIVAQSSDTTLTRGALDIILADRFGSRIDMLGDDLRRDFVEYWIIHIAWLREAQNKGIFEDDEVLDRMDIVERMTKSALFIEESVKQGITITDEDLLNYQQAHEVEFRSFRNISFLQVDFKTREEAQIARDTIENEDLDTDSILAHWQNTAIIKSFTAEEFRLESQDLQDMFVGVEEGNWTKIVRNQSSDSSQWSMWQVLSRNMPLFSESKEMHEAVFERVSEAFAEAEINRVIDEMKKITKLRKVKLRD